MKTRWRLLESRIDAMAVRERGLLLITGLVLIWFLFELAWLGLLRDDLSELGAQEAQLAARAQTQQAERLVLQARELEDPAARVRERIARVEDEIRALDDQLRQHTRGFVDPREMPRLLTDLILGSERLVLLDLHSEPPISLDPGGERDANVPVLFRHGLVLRLSGDYLAFLDYLRAIEAMPWQLFWDALHVEVDADGRRHFRLRVFTLSLSEDWLGV